MKEIPFSFSRLPSKMLVVKNEYGYHQWPPEHVRKIITFSCGSEDMIDHRMVGGCTLNRMVETKKYGLSV